MKQRLKYAVMRQEANANHDVYVRVSQQVEEAGLAAGSHGSEISVVDYARQPVKPVSPDLPVYMAVTLFVSLWLAFAAVLMRESIRSKAAQVLVSLALVAARLVSGAHRRRLRAHLVCRRVLPAFRNRRRQEASQTQRMRLPFGILAGCETSRRSARRATPTQGADGCADRPGDLLEVSEAHTPGDARFGSCFRGGHGNPLACR